MKCHNTFSKLHHKENAYKLEKILISQINLFRYTGKHNLLEIFLRLQRCKNFLK